MKCTCSLDIFSFFLFQILRPFCKVPSLKVWKYYTTENLSTGPTYDLELINDVTTTTENEQQSGDGKQVGTVGGWIACVQMSPVLCCF